MFLLIESVCFACEVEGTEQEAMDTNLSSCPHCHTLTENTPKLLAHIAAHILYYTMIKLSSDPCGLFFKPSPPCKWVLCISKATIRVDIATSTCTRLTQFYHIPAR